MKLHELLYKLGRGSLVEAKQTLSRIAKNADISVYLDELNRDLVFEIRRWKRRQLIASLRGDDPRLIEPPATLAPALIASYISSRNKLILSDFALSDIDIGELRDENESRGI